MVDVDFFTVIFLIVVVNLVIFIISIKNDKKVGLVIRVVTSTALAIAHILALERSSYIIDVVAAIIWIINIIAWSIKLGQKL